MDSKKTLGPMFGAYRKVSGKTQKEVSLALGYACPQIVSNFERGVCDLPMEKMVAYAEECEIPRILALNILFSERVSALNDEILGALSSFYQKD